MNRFLLAGVGCVASLVLLAIGVYMAVSRMFDSIGP